MKEYLALTRYFLSLEIQRLLSFSGAIQILFYLNLLFIANNDSILQTGLIGIVLLISILKNRGSERFFGNENSKYLISIPTNPRISLLAKGTFNYLAILPLYLIILFQSRSTENDTELYPPYIFIWFHFYLELEKYKFVEKYSLSTRKTKNFFLEIIDLICLLEFIYALKKLLQIAIEHIYSNSVSGISSTFLSILCLGGIHYLYYRSKRSHYYLQAFVHVINIKSPMINRGLIVFLWLLTYIFAGLAKSNDKERNFQKLYGTNTEISELEDEFKESVLDGNLKKIEDLAIPPSVRSLQSDISCVKLLA